MVRKIQVVGWKPEPEQSLYKMEENLAVISLTREPCQSGTLGYRYADWRHKQKI